MAKDDFLVGLEIGTSKICVVVGQSRPDGSIKIIGVSQVPSRGVRKGEIVDFETAGKCVHDAVAEAEEKSDTQIRSVYLGITGAHIASFNNRGGVNIPVDQDEIEVHDLDQVRSSAREVSIPSPNAFIHSILQHYYVDGREGVLNPLGMVGHRLEADFHIIHGISTRIKNTIRCVRELPLEVDDVVFNGLAAAQVILDQHQKDLGALVIDMGGGTTDYIMYLEGAVKQSGVLAVGGDHITNDISMGLQIPVAKAEKLKIVEGSVILGNSLPGESIYLKDEHGFAGKEIERETLNTIIHMRVRETLELLKRKIDADKCLHFLGAGVAITGGCSLLRGIDNLAEEILGLPVRVARAQSMSGITSAFEDPQCSAAIGLIKYAQAVQMDERPADGWLGMLKNVFSFTRMF
jgi:cell division protein FtsA